MSSAIADSVAEFVIYCRVERGISAKAADGSYGAGLRASLIPYCAERGITDPAEFDEAEVSRLAIWIVDRKRADGEPLARATQLAYLKAVKVWLRWAHGHPRVSDRIGLPKLRKQRREVLTDDEVTLLEQSARTERDRCIVRLMAETGAREGEVAALRVEDVTQQDRRFGFVWLRGKTGQRKAPITPELYRRLRVLVVNRPPLSPPGLFLADRCLPGEAKVRAVTGRGVYEAVRTAAERAQLGKRVYPHLLRHTAITRMVARGMHPALVSEICGVSVSVIASNYSHPSERQMWEAAMKTLEPEGQ